MGAPWDRADELLEVWSATTSRPVPAFAPPVPRPRAIRHPGWVLMVVVATALTLVGLLALAGGPSIPPSPSADPLGSGPPASFSPVPSPSVAATFPTTVDGLTVQSVSELLAARASGDAKGGPFALRGYWTNRNFMHSCNAPVGQPGELELRCSDGEWGITERDEPILDLVIKRQANETQIGGAPAAGPHLTPWVPSTPEMTPLFSLPFVNDQFWPPVPIVVTGHFDDPKARECRKEARQLCQDRFVLDHIVTFDPESVPAPTPTPSPTPFPVGSPPPALFSDDACYQGVPKDFRGWIPFADLKIQMSGPGYVYAMVTRDVIPIGEWWENPGYPGHKTRWWGQGVCFALNETSMGFGAVTGTTYLEVDDGRHIAGRAP